MKNLIKTMGRKGAMMSLSLIAMVSAALLTALPDNSEGADMQGYPTTFTTVTNLPATVATGTISNSINSYASVPQGRGMAFQARFNVSSGTSNAVFQISPSLDGTNISSQIWPLTGVASGTNIITVTTNWSKGSLDGYLGLFLIACTNQNAGTLTNFGALFSRANQ